jgi:hypothetical protein
MIITNNQAPITKGSFSFFAKRFSFGYCNLVIDNFKQYSLSCIITEVPHAI